MRKFIIAIITYLAKIIFCYTLIAQQVIPQVFHPLNKKENHKIGFKKHVSNNDHNQKYFSNPTPAATWQPAKRIYSSWDTLLNAWNYEDSTLFTYNSNGSPTNVVTYPVSSAPYPAYQKVSTYDAQNNVLQDLTQNWNTGSSAWENSWKDSYTYNSSNQQTQYLSQTWNTSSWDNNDKGSFTYNNNVLTQEVWQSWNTGASAWEDVYKVDYTYNANNQLIQSIGQYWTGSAWENTYKENITYNSSGILTEAMYQYWNISVWENGEKYTNVVWYQWTGDYTTSLLLGYLEKEWDGVAWQDAYRETDTYDAQGNLTDWLYEAWQTNSWVKDDEEKHIFTYNINNNITQDIIQYWIPSLQSVRNVIKYDYSNYTLYSDVEENPLSENNIAIYPNPCSGEFTLAVINEAKRFQIDDGEVSVYNVFGEKVFVTSLNSNYEIFSCDMRAQPNGIYLLQIKTGNKSINKKVVIQK